MTKDSQIHNYSSKWFGDLAGLPFFREKDGSPVIFRRLSSGSTKGEVESAGDRFFFGIWCSIILSIEFLIFVKWWML